MGKHLLGILLSKRTQLNSIKILIFNILNHIRSKKHSYDIVLTIPAWVVGSYMALYLRYDSIIPSQVLKRMFLLLPIMLIFVNLVNLLDNRIYGTPNKKSFGELESNIRKFLLVCVVFSIIMLTTPYFLLPKSFPVLAAGISLTLNSIVKNYSYSLYLRLKLESGIKPIALYGGGLQGQLLLRKIADSPQVKWKPIIIIDDYLTNQKIHGIKIVSGQNLETVLKKFLPELLVVTFSTFDNKKLESIQEICLKLNIELRIIPPVLALTRKNFEIEDIRLPTLEELIGKKSIKIDTELLSSIYKNKIVLITGAGGSIGSEIARQVYNFKPKMLLLLDRDESALLETNLSLDINSAFTQENLILADIRDPKRISEIFSKYQPEIVIHAAALKHLQMLEQSPNEAFKTNIEGTSNVLESAVNNKVQIFINISTDKASDPTSVLGKSKLISERMTTTAGLNKFIPLNAKYVSVRFGNVFGSRGSVLHTFQKQIENGGPITITAKGVKRYFMTIEEAVHLVLKSAKFGNTGETLILEMGDPIEIEQVARKLIDYNRKNIEIKYLSLRNGEKIIEALIGKNEKIINVVEDSITKIVSSPLNEDVKLENWQTFFN